MKLRNKRTREIATLTLSTNGEDMIIMGNDMLAHITKLSELKDYEDYEEPKGYWYINEFGTPTEITHTRENIYDKQRKNFGNYFETEEEAEKAAEKLKAWHRLMDYWETEVMGWEIRDMPTGGNWQTVNVKFNIKARKEPMELLDILFEGEE